MPKQRRPTIGAKQRPAPEKRRAKPSKPTGVGEILAGLITSTSLGGEIEKARIWEHWPDLAGPHLAAHGQPHAVRDATLIVRAESPVWMHKFAYRKWDILKRINLLAGRELISDIFVTLDDDPDLPAEDHDESGATGTKPKPKRRRKSPPPEE